MVHALDGGWAPAEAFRFGMAPGAAAVLNSGTGLTQAEDIWRLYRDAFLRRSDEGAGHLSA